MKNSCEEIKALHHLEVVEGFIKLAQIFSNIHFF